MKKNKLFEFVTINYHKDKRGVLFMMQEKGAKVDALPTKIRRVFILKNLNPNLSRGNHTLKTTTQIIFLLSGSCEVELDNGNVKEKIKLNKFNKGLLIYPMVWRTLKNFSKDAILLVVADKKHTEKDYIKDYENFIQQVRCGI